MQPVSSSLIVRTPFPSRGSEAVAPTVVYTTAVLPEPPAASRQLPRQALPIEATVSASAAVVPAAARQQAEVAGAGALPAAGGAGEPARAGRDGAGDGPEGAFDRRQSTQARIEQRQLEAEIRQLRKRDTAVRNHERIHASIAGAHGGAPQFQYQRGPDGVLYAVAGHVAIDLSPVPGNPQATLAKARTVQRAALAPADPSAADRAIAVRAGAIAADAASQISQQAQAAKTADESSATGFKPVVAGD